MEEKEGKIVISLSERKTLIENHQKTLWCSFANIFLGFWLLFSHFFLGYTSFVLSLNDFIAGIIVVILGLFSLSYRYWLAPWGIVFLGIWLNFAPLIFWAPDSSCYMNDTMVGSLLIAFALLIPGLPGVIEKEGKGIPSGWSYNPSAWNQRIPVVALACVGWFISRYLAAFQLGYIETVWDPIFGSGTKDVITSSVASFLPVPDAGLGAFAYTLEALLGLKGGPNRWRAMPWIVVGFAFLVVPLGIVSIILVCLQPILVGHWCFLCLLAAGAMLIMVMLTVDEMVATLQFLYQGKKEGQLFWELFFRGGEVNGIRDDVETATFYGNFWSLIKAWRFGVSFSPGLLLSLLLGGWIIFTPSIFALEKGISDFDHLLGALIVVFSVISSAEVIRSLRYIFFLFGLMLSIGTWLFPDISLWVNLSHSLVGIIVLGLAFIRGPICYSYGIFTNYIK